MAVDNEAICFDVPAKVASSKVKVEKEGLVDNWSRYVAAPDDALQEIVGFKTWSMALLLGLDKDGVAGGLGTVVKLHTLDQALTPPEFFARTRQ